VGGTIAFIVCNMPFKPPGLPKGRVKSRECMPEMIPTNIETLCCQQERVFTQTMAHKSLACLKKKKKHHHQHQQGIQHRITHKWTIKTSPVLKSVE
jgi:hypothetical protein